MQSIISLDSIAAAALATDKAESAVIAALADRGNATRTALALMTAYAAHDGYADVLARNAKKPASKQSPNPNWTGRGKVESALKKAGVSTYTARSLCTCAVGILRKHDSLAKADVTLEAVQKVVGKQVKDSDTFIISSIDNALNLYGRKDETVQKQAQKQAQKQEQKQEPVDPAAPKPTGNPAAGADPLPGSPEKVSEGTVTAERKAPDSAAFDNQKPAAMGRMMVAAFESILRREPAVAQDVLRQMQAMYAKAKPTLAGDKPEQKPEQQVA